MSSSFASSSSSSVPPPPLVTVEEFKTFHNIDRILYATLVRDLCRDPSESMQVMALWIWLERVGHVRGLVTKILSLQNTHINALASEAVLCLNCIENDHLHLYFDSNDVPLMNNLGNSNLSLRFFHDHRLVILRGVTKVLNEVCVRALDDISRQAILENNKKAEIYGHGRSRNNIVMENSWRVTDPGVVPRVYNINSAHPQFNVGSNNNIRNSSGSDNQLGHLGGSDSYSIYDVVGQRQDLDGQTFGDVLGIGEVKSEEEKGGVPVDERTIFLTFSRGFPISLNEVREFFTRKYGDCIEAIYFQEVLEKEQPLYARLILHSQNLIQYVLEGKTKAKFSINGKHVWARKYVRKGSRSPSSPPESPPKSQPTSPVANKINLKP